MSENKTAELIIPQLQTFRPITLDEMDKVQLLNRMDTKFVFQVSKLPAFLEKIKERYRLLETNPLRYADYNSLYYDTPDFQLYFTHHRGKSGRYKIRFRSYNDTKLFFLEIKHKNNKGRTDKSRKIKELIEYGEFNLSEISYKLGYSSPAHLTNQFKNSTGYTPSYFKSITGNNRKPLDDL